MTNELEKNPRWTSIALIFTLKVKQINALGLFAAVMFRVLLRQTAYPYWPKDLLRQRINKKHLLNINIYILKCARISVWAHIFIYILSFNYFQSILIHSLFLINKIMQIILLLIFLHFYNNHYVREKDWKSKDPLSKFCTSSSPSVQHYRTETLWWQLFTDPRVERWVWPNYFTDSIVKRSAWKMRFTTGDNGRPLRSDYTVPPSRVSREG